MSRITVLDGGMGHLIKQWGVSIPGLPYEQQFLAGCLALHAAPETVSRAHAAYIDVGCDVITTNNFAATIHNLSKVQKESQWLEYCKEAGHLARRTADSSSRTVLVAGCLPPLQESYQTTNLPDAASLRAQYTDIARALQSSVDIFLAETLCTVAEAQAALDAAAQAAPDKPVWVSFTLEDSTAVCLRNKQPLASALQHLASHSNLAAVLVNCCAPVAVTAAIPVLKQHAPRGTRVGCYANGFKTTTTQWLSGTETGLVDAPPDDYGHDNIITPEAYVRHAEEWAACGADIIGGCCGIGPQHMQMVVTQLKQDV